VGIIGSVGIRSTTERGMVLTRARRDATSRTRVRFVGLIVGFAALATMTTAITAYVVAKAGIVTPAHSPFSIGVAIPLAPPFAVAALLGLGLTGALAWPIVGRILGTTGPTHVLEDVGHELRTPITIMRGHLELLRVDDQTEVNRTRTLLLGELDRMTRLVEDLKTLASAERPGFLEPTGVDVELLLDDVLDKARALGDRAWDVDARSEAVVFADGQRLTQALLELARGHDRVRRPSRREDGPPLGARHWSWRAGRRHESDLPAISTWHDTSAGGFRPRSGDRPRDRPRSRRARRARLRTRLGRPLHARPAVPARAAHVHPQASVGPSRRGDVGEAAAFLSARRPPT